jgi:hypothetical protein
VEDVLNVMRQVAGRNCTPFIYMVTDDELVGGGGHIALVGEIRRAYEIFVGKPEGKTEVEGKIILPTY